MQFLRGGVAALAALCAFVVTAPAQATQPMPMPALDAAIENRDYRRIEAVIVERGGVVQFENYYGDTNAETRIDARSAGKSITALAVGIAIDEGALSGVDARVFDLLADRAPFEHDHELKRAITVRDFLTMSSALDCNDWEPSPGNEERMYDRRDWTRFALDIPIAENYARDESGFGRYSYCTAGAFLLGRVLERATATPFDEYVQSRIFTPLGIEGAIWRRSPTGEVQSGGQLSLRARDFSAIGRMILNRGVDGAGNRIVSRQWLGQMFQPVRRATQTDGYGYLWWIRNYRTANRTYTAFYMSGNGGNKVVLLPEIDTVVVILSTFYNQRTMHQQTNDIIEQHILPALEAADAAR